MGQHVVRPFAHLTTAPGLSHAIWKDCPIDAYLDPPMHQNRAGVGFIERFDGRSGLFWTETQIDAGTFGGVGYPYTLNGPEVTDDGLQSQVTFPQRMFLAEADKTIWFEGRIKISDIDNQWFLGLSIVDATFFTAGVISSTDYLGFYWAAGDTAAQISFVGEKAGAIGTPVDMGDLVDDTYVRLGFRVTGASSALVATAFINGVANATTIVNANISVLGLTPTIANLNEESTGHTPIMSIDWIAAAQMSDDSA